MILFFVMFTIFRMILMPFGNLKLNGTKFFFDDEMNAEKVFIALVD